jgi:hypothetical protein
MKKYEIYLPLKYNDGREIVEIIAVADRKTQKFFQDFKGRLKLIL